MIRVRKLKAITPDRIAYQTVLAGAEMETHLKEGFVVVFKAHTKIGIFEIEIPKNVVIAACGQMLTLANSAKPRLVSPKDVKPIHGATSVRANNAIARPRPKRKGLLRKSKAHR